MARRYPGVQPWHLLASIIFAIGFSVVYAGTVAEQAPDPVIVHDRPSASLTTAEIESLRALVELVRQMNLPRRDREIIDRVGDVLEAIDDGDVSVAPETTTTTSVPATTTTSTTTTTTTTTAPRPGLDEQVGDIVDQLTGIPDALP